MEQRSGSGTGIQLTNLAVHGMFQILFDMTRPLLRVRSAKVPEEGELSGSEEEEEGMYFLNVLLVTAIV